MTERGSADVRLDARIPELDGVRALAIALVLVWHYVICLYRPLPGSVFARVLKMGSLTWSGVDLFFVLSGFLIGGILLDHRESPNLFRVFYIRRACRIFPLYFLWVALYIVVGASSDESRLSGLFADPLPLATYLTYTQNVVMAFRQSFGPPWLGVTWSLAVEEQFYLVFPLLIRYVSARRLPVVLAALIALAPALRTAFYLSGRSQYFGYVLLPCRWDALFLGVLGAHLARRPGLIEALRARPWPLHASFVVLAIGVVWLGREAPSVNDPAMQTFGLTWLAAFYLSFIALAVVVSARPLRALLCSRAAVTLGAISYCVYLCHQVVMGILQSVLVVDSAARALAATAAAIAVTAAIGLLSYHFIERPFLKLGRGADYAAPVRRTGVRGRLVSAAD